MGGRYINGKPAEVPPNTRRYKDGTHRGPAEVPQRFTTQLVRSTMVHNGHSKGPPYQVRKEFGPAGVYAIRIAGVKSSKSQPERLHPGAKVWIAEVRRRVPQPRPRQWSAEAITVSGIIIITNVEVDDRGSNQILQLKIIPQLKSHNLAGVFRYWLVAIRTVIDSTLSPVQTGSLLTHQS